MPKQVIKYQCNFCTRSWVSKSRAVQHELNCFRNPDVKSCWTCSNSSERTSEDPAWCNVLKKEIYVHGSPVMNCVYWSREFLDDEWDD
jgi:hypothetical protein